MESSLMRFPLRWLREWRLRRLTRQALTLISLRADRVPGSDVALALWLLRSKDHVEVWLNVTAFYEEARSLQSQVASIAKREPFRQRSALGSRVTVAALALGVSALFCGALWVRYASTSSTEYSTDIGEHRAFRLPDGTSVHLNTNSRIAVTFTSDRRRVELLQGEALFDVEHDARPFRVRSGTAVIEDIGTRFDVRLDAHQIYVAVIEGRVRVGITAHSQSEEPWPRVAVDTLNAGESVSIPMRADAGPPVVERTRDEVLASRLAWTSGMLRFRGDSLKDAVREFNRYNVRQLQIADPEIGELRIGGQFLARSPDRFAQALQNWGVSAVEPDEGSGPNEPIRLVRSQP